MSTMCHLPAAILFFMSCLCTATLNPSAMPMPSISSILVTNLTALSNDSNSLPNKTSAVRSLNKVVQSSNQRSPTIFPTDSINEVSTEGETRSLAISAFEAEQNTENNINVVSAVSDYIESNITNLGSSNITASGKDFLSTNGTFNAINEKSNVTKLMTEKFIQTTVMQQGIQAAVPSPTSHTTVSKMLNAINQQNDTLTKESKGNRRAKKTEATSTARASSTSQRNEIGLKIPSGERVKYVSGLPKRTESEMVLQGGVASRAMGVFLAIAIALVAFLALIYFIYARSQRKDLFSHHRLYDNGYDEPVHYLDGPMDFYDGTPIEGGYGSTVCDRPASLQLPAQACYQGPPVGISSMEHLHDIIQLAAMPPQKISKTDV